MHTGDVYGHITSAYATELFSSTYKEVNIVNYYIFTLIWIVVIVRRGANNKQVC